MSPRNTGSLVGPSVPPVGVRPLPPPRFGGRPVPPGLPPRMPRPPRMPLHPRMPQPPINPIFGSMRQMLPTHPGPTGVTRPNSLLPLFPPGLRLMAPIMPPMRPMGRGVPRGSVMGPWPRRIPPRQMVPPMRPRFTAGNSNQNKGKGISNTEKVTKFEELELKKPWMTDEIRSEIQKKNKLYAKAKKNKDAVEWEEFKDLRNKVTRMIRDAKNEYFVKHPEQVHLYSHDEEPHDQRDENCTSSDDECHYCEICDRDFSSKNELSEHKSSHKLCGIDGCTFSAHPLLVEKHIRMQHSTGLYQRMKNLSTPEDIEKWIVERKKKYPTKANTELRKAQEMEKLQRGEIIKQNLNMQRKVKKVINVREKRRRSRKQHEREINNTHLHTKKVYRGLLPFAGTNSLEEDEKKMDLKGQADQVDICNKIIENISDEDDIPYVVNIPALVANYNSETDDDEIPEELPIQKVKEDFPDTNVEENTQNNAHSSKKICHKSNKQDQIHEKSQLYKRDNDSNKKNEINQITKYRYRKNLPRYRNKLLHQLLSRSIQHERNLICQCVKYIVDNNFFD